MATTLYASSIKNRLDTFLNGARKGARPVIGASRGTNRGGVPTNTLNMGPSVNNPYSFLRGGSQVNAGPIVPQTGYNNMQYNGPSGASLYDAGTSPYTDTGVTKTQQYVFGGRTPATSKTPVVKRDTPTEQLSVDTSDVDAMDKGQLQSMIDMAYVKGGVLTEEEQIRLMKAQRRLQEIAMDEYKESMVNPYGQQIEQATQERERISDGLSSDQIKALSAQEKLLNEQQRNSSIAEEDLIEQERKIIGDMYNARGMSNSSEATDALLKLETGLTNSLRTFNSIREAELEKYKQELMGANTKRIEQYDTYIDSLTAKSQEFQASLANQINEYNMQSSMSYQNKLDSLFETSKSMEKQMAVEYDEEDTARAEMYAGVILDKNGDIDPKVLATVPQYLIPLVYQLASKNRGAKGNDYKFYESKGGGWVFNPATGETEFRPGGGGTGTDSGFGMGPIPSGVQEVIIANGKQTNKTLDKTAADPLNSALVELNNKGIYTLIGSGTRSSEEQQKLYEDYLSGKGGLAAPPGYSKHENGMAVDIYSDDKFSAPSKEIIDTLRKYGWEHQAIPGDMGHFEYVGKSNQISDWLIGNIDMRMSDTERAAKIGYIESAVASGDTEALGQMIRDNILKDEEISKSVYSASAIIGAIERVEEMLNEYKSSGNNTNILNAMAERIANALGITTNVALARINGSLGALVADYIRAISGAQASEMEASRLNSFLPKIKNTADFNQALIDNIKSMATAKQRTTLETRFGVDPTYMKIAFRELYPEGDGMFGATETGGGRDETLYRN